MKIALGLFHFNPHWGGEIRSGHRHCTEGLRPFLAALGRRPKWRTSLEISGSGLTFLSTNYPEQLTLLRRLIERGQVELISSLYTPSIWVAFPRRDVINSVKRNQQCLKRLGLPCSRIFFAQEAFFGEGVHTFGEYFDIAVCKDDYLNYFYPFDFTTACVLLGEMKVVVASSHLLYESQREVTREPESTAKVGLTHRHRLHIQQASELNDGRNFPARSGRWRDIEWLWYHCGDGNHFSTIFKPQDLEHSYRDGPWEHWCELLLDRIEVEGYQFATIGEFVNKVDYREAPQLPLLIEGSWNAKRTGGVYLWMGDFASPWGNDSAVLTSICRARERIIQCEETIYRSSGGHGATGRRQDQAAGSQTARKSRLWPIFDKRLPEAVLSHSPALSDAWEMLLHAEISDSLGWWPSYEGVQTSMGQADRALAIATELLYGLPSPVRDERQEAGDVQLHESESLHLDERAEVWPTIEIFGAKGSLAIDQPSPRHRVCEACFEAADPHFGVRVPFETDSLVFCPAGVECLPIEVKLADLKPDVISLPLTNGLLKLQNSTFVVKEVRFIHIAARVFKHTRVMEYAVLNGRPGQRYVWRLHLIKCSLADAVEFANKLNYTGCVGCTPTARMCDVRGLVQRRLDKLRCAREEV